MHTNQMSPGVSHSDSDNVTTGRRYIDQLQKPMLIAYITMSQANVWLVVHLIQGLNGLATKVKPVKVEMESEAVQNEKKLDCGHK